MARRALTIGSMRSGLAAAVLIAAAMLAPPAFAKSKPAKPDTGPSMRFVVVRSAQPGCEPTCAEWISAEGAIMPGTPALLRKTLDTLRGRRLPIVVTSPGGDVDAALALGRLIRKNRLDIAVGMTRFMACQPDEKDCHENDGRGAKLLGTPYAGGAYCASACPLMLAGGVRRLAGQWAYLGVHQITTIITMQRIQYRTKYRIVNGKKKIIETKIVGRKNAGTRKSYEMSPAIEKKVRGYLKEMGVDGGVVDIMKKTPADQMQQIPLVPMLNMNMVTSMDAVDALTAGGICKAVPAAANCRVFTMSDLKPAGGQTL